MRRGHVFALVDCNSFYCSCERVFNPKVRGRPVIVLSNNDGCAVARSDEAKNLGIKMGAPYFKILDIIQKHGVAVFSSNYALYGDMSRRVMETLSMFAPSMEVYSIDEAFLGLDGHSGRDLDVYGREIKRTVWRWTGIPVSVGVGSTKTLAKAANKLAKRVPGAGGVLDLLNHPDPDTLLEMLPCRDMWGIGSQWARLLESQGMRNALQLKKANRAWVRAKMGVVGERMVWELNGVSCLQLEEVEEPKKNITCSRSFGKLVTELEDLQEAVATYTSRAAEKVRKQKSVVSVVQVYLTTNPYREADPQYAPSAMLTLAEPTSNTPELIMHAARLLQKIYRRGFRYKKAGVLCCGLISKEEVPQGLFNRAENREKMARLMETVDRINARMGRGTVRFGAMGIEQGWKLRAERKSPAFTTRLAELPVAYAR